MRAYNLAMLMIFVNCGFALAAAFGVFPLGEYTGVFEKVLPIVTHPITMAAIALLLMAGTSVFASAVVTDRGQSYWYFYLIYWLSFLEASAILYPLTAKYPGTEIFYTIYSLATFLIFLMGMIQMPLGGVKGHV